jgi:adenine-specific DNA-methyltransferase
MRELVEHVQAKWILASFNNEGYLDRDDMIAILSTRGEVEVREVGHDRYVGAKIGIYNPQGEKVGKISHLQNVEYVFRVRCA